MREEDLEIAVKVILNNFFYFRFFLSILVRDAFPIRFGVLFAYVHYEM